MEEEADRWMGGLSQKKKTQRKERGHNYVCGLGLRVHNASYFICIDCQISAELDVYFISVAKCISDHH